MNFELVKKLKDAGFSLRHGDIEVEGIRYDLPCLEELIEACPTNIGKATFVLGSANQGKEWVACYFDFVTNRGSDFNETGSTPVEAVAKLWLALHAAGTGA
jgi:hypothetical protein